jgi:hypothetical protein
MQVSPHEYQIDELVRVFEAGSLLRNPEYQRGEAWNETQKATFIDSIFRRYPVPALFLHKVVSAGLGGSASEKFEIVDGQQRLTALRDFKAGKFSLLRVDGNSKLRLPKSVRSREAPWAGRVYSDLSSELTEQFLKTTITVFQIGPDAHPDEVRDLFIRLQSGTALSRQQIRDAWPGNLGPFIESLAGKLDRKPSIMLFRLVDKRGQRSDDDDQRDMFVSDRQFCAQLFRIFMARAADPYAYPSVSANELDSAYHEFTDFDPRGTAAARFKEALEETTAVFIAALGLRTKKVKIKVRLLDIKAVFMFAQDAARDPEFKLNTSALAQRIVGSDDAEKPAGRSTSSTTLKKYYEWWRETVAVNVGIRLDPNRAFDQEQKATIRKRDEDRCGVCQLEVLEEDAEFDHFPVPHRDGGRTLPENARLVHRACHPRGRPLES